MKYLRTLAMGVAIALAGTAAQAATLGLLTSAPTIGAEGAVDYFEFGPDGDLSMFGAPATVSSLTTLDVPSAEVEFAIGFDLADPENGSASGGFAVTDSLGTYLFGDLLALGSRSFGATGGLIELQFDILGGRGAAEWTDTLLMNVIFRDSGPDPFAFFMDGNFYDAEIGMFAVVGSVNPPPDPAPIPLPSSAFLLIGAMGILAASARRRRSAVT